MSVKKKLSILRNVLIFTAIAWFLVTFLIVPVLSTVKTTFFTDGAFSMQSVQKLLSSERVKRSLSNTYKMAFWSFVTVTINGVFQVLVTEYFDIKGSKLLELAFMTPLLYGGISLVTGYNYVYASNGVVTKLLASWISGMNVNWFTGFTGVLFVHTFAMTTSHILFVKTAFKDIDYSTIEAARSLGCSSIQTFFGGGAAGRKACHVLCVYSLDFKRAQFLRRAVNAGWQELLYDQQHDPYAERPAQL